MIYNYTWHNTIGLIELVLIDLFRECRRAVIITALILFYLRAFLMQLNG